MAVSQRDLADYTQQYRALPFEPLQVEYRRRRVLQEVARVQPRRLLEVGCGERPLFLDLPDTQVTVVEPAAEFAASAQRLALNRAGVRVVQACLEDFDCSTGPYDMVVVSCVLHEVPDAKALLDAVRRLCGPRSVVHVNVPHARSLHRLLAVAMGLIADPATPSDTQRTMQQRATPYDRQLLEAELARSGFCVIDGGTLFVKPFTHAQMQQLVDQGFMTTAMLDGLDRLVQWLPDLGSELWVNARIAGPQETNDE
ncbi:MAG TPA: class I SAM-dependent methyltransferase [Rubrivivax sp.]|nr:class I SAM-dependent methyltransferase [Rubrivivax sp.]